MKLKPLIGSKTVGLLFIVIATLITIFIKCPSNALYIPIYALFGMGISLLLDKSAEKSTSSFKFRNISVALTGAVVLPLILIFYNPIDTYKADDCRLQLNKTNTTIFIHGKKGKQDIILKQGYVIMDLGSERKKAPINENGQAFFQNLQIGDSVRLNVDFSEPFKTIYPDSVYTILRNGNIYLSVTLQGIDKIRGKVLYNDYPLNDVNVQVDTLLTTTDKMGNFSFNIPESLQSNEYNVWFTKEGFKSKSVPAFPQTGQPLVIVMERK